MFVETVVMGGQPFEIQYQSPAEREYVMQSLIETMQAANLVKNPGFESASAGAPSALTIFQDFTFSQRPQALLRISNTVKTNLVHTSRITITSIGGSGTGAITYSVTGSGCNVSGATLTATGATICTVTATKSASSIYAETTATATFSFSS